MTQQPVRIVQLEAENLKRLTAVQITPEGAIVEIAGQNGAGKSSVLDAITYALAGKNVHPDRPIRDGATDAKVVVNLGDLIVTRTWTAKGTYLKVTTPDGASYGSGQAILDKMVGSLTFDPLAFSRQKPSEQAETLKRVAGIDLDEFDQYRAKVYATRTDVNRELKRAQAQLEQMPEPEAYPDYPGEEVSVAALMEQRRQLEQKKREADAAVSDAQHAREAVEQWDATVELAEQRVTDLERQLEHARAHLKESRHSRHAAETKASELEAVAANIPDPSFAEIDAKLEQADQHNRQVREANERIRQVEQQQEQVVEQEAEVKRLKDEALSLTAQLDEIDQQKQQALADAALPIEGLALDDGGVTFNGIPFNQLSSAEQLRVSAAMAAAMNPRLRVMLIREGSLLDDQSLQMLGEFAEENDFQVWVEMVSSGSPGAVVIEDGHVREHEVSMGVAEAEAEAGGAA